MRVMRMVGLFQTRDESAYVAGRLKPLFDEDFRKQGFVNLGEALRRIDLTKHEPQVLVLVPTRELALQVG